jgi:hypothetical protein
MHITHHYHSRGRRGSCEHLAPLELTDHLKRVQRMLWWTSHGGRRGSCLSGILFLEPVRQLKMSRGPAMPCVSSISDCRSLMAIHFDSETTRQELSKQCIHSIIQFHSTPPNSHHDPISPNPKAHLDRVTSTKFTPERKKANSFKLPNMLKRGIIYTCRGVGSHEIGKPEV